MRAASEPDEHRTPLVVVDDDGCLTGMLVPSDLVFADPATALRDFVCNVPSHIQALAPREDVVEEFRRSNAPSLPVVDTNDRVLGPIRHDALVRAVHEEASVDLQTMVGASAEERALSPVSFAVRKRLLWLQINLVTAFLAAAIVGIFEDTIARFTALAILLPVVAGQSGNTGAQALAVTMRGLLLREVRLRHWRQMGIKEMLVGFFNGVGLAITTSIAVFVWSRSLGLAGVIGISIVVSNDLLRRRRGSSAAGVGGSVRQDPAQSPSIVLTTVTDAVAFSASSASPHCCRATL